MQHKNTHYLNSPSFGNRKYTIKLTSPWYKRYNKKLLLHGKI